jgi:hypothetical protein
VEAKTKNGTSSDNEPLRKGTETVNTGTEPESNDKTEPIRKDKKPRRKYKA